MVDDSDNTILAWQNSPVLNITTKIELEQEPPYTSRMEVLEHQQEHHGLVPIWASETKPWCFGWCSRTSHSTSVMRLILRNYKKICLILIF